MNFNQMGSPFGPPPGAYPETATPLIAVFERDDSIAVPLLSQLRVIGYDVRAARTPVELFDIAQKHPVALILVDIGSAAASRREFWVALDAQRRGRSIQVLTFRVTTTEWGYESEPEDSARALADVEVSGTHDLQPIIEATAQRVPLRGGMPPMSGGGQWPALGNGMGGGLGGNPFGAMPPGVLGQGDLPFLGGGGVAPMVLGLNGSGFAPPGYPESYALPALPQYGAPHPGAFGGAGYDPAAASQAQSPFAHPAGANPFAPGGSEPSPFDLPLTANPFAAGPPTAGQMPTALGGVAGPRGGSPLAAPGNGRAAPPVADAWVPPGTDGLGAPPPPPRMPPAGPEPRWNPQAFMPAAPDDETAVGFPTYDTAEAGGWLVGGDDPQEWDATAPVGAQLPATAGRQGERALGSVLVEGAL
ncbi:MAG TPA: hypothetical protein VF832_17195, partial [Longimicrobiales bacterium]